MIIGKEWLNKLLKFAGVVVVLTIVATFCVNKVGSVLVRTCFTDLVSMQTPDGDYSYSFINSTVSFKANVANGGTSFNPVVIVLSPDCSITTESLSYTHVNDVDDNKEFVFDSQGEYDLTVEAQVVNQDRRCAKFNFSIKEPYYSDLYRSDSELSQVIYEDISYNAQKSEAIRKFGSKCHCFTHLVKNVLFGYTNNVVFAEQADVNVELVGIYHKDFGTYEVSIGNEFFYANISNGGIGAPPAYFDIPRDLAVNLEKDGNKIEFKNKANINEPGSYRMTLSTIVNDIKYIGVYRFRLQEGSMSTKPSASTDPSLSGLSSATYKPGTILSSNPIATMATNPTIGSTDSVELTGVSAIVGLKETYSPQNDVFIEQSAKGLTFYSSIPNGSVVSESVKFTFPKGCDISMTKNGEDLDYSPGVAISDSGAYVLKLNTKDYGFQISNGQQPTFTFRIVNTPVNNLTVYNTPLGFKLMSVKFDDEYISVQGKTLWLANDGKYEIVIVHEQNPSLWRAITVTRDTKPPVFTIDGIKDGIATFKDFRLNHGDDVEAVALYRNSKQIDSRSSITDPGDYRVVVSDIAGNSAEITFTKKYSLSGISLALVMIIGILMFSATIYLIYNRHRKRVR